MSKRKINNYRVKLFSLAFLVFFGIVFSLGIMTGKRYIPDDVSVSPQVPSSEDAGVSSLDDQAVEQVPASASEESSDRQTELQSLETESLRTASEESSDRQTEPAGKQRDEDLSAMLDPDHKYTIQISSFQSKKTANRAVRFYRENGYPAFIREYSPSEITTFYRVRIGTFQSKEEAIAYRNEIKDKDKDKFYITVND